MKQARILVFLFSLFAAAKGESIVGGSFVDPSLKDHPANFNTVALARFSGGRYHVFCSGSIISERHILTARHCTVDRDSADLFIMFGHDIHLAQPNQFRPVTQKWEYGDGTHWQAEFPNYDVAIVEIEGEIPKDYRPLPLAGLNPDLQPNDQWMIAGFGNQNLSHQNIQAGQNKWLDVGVQEYLDTVFFRHLVFVQAPVGSGSCHGDSGGPLYRKKNQRWEIVGMTNGFDLAITDDSLNDTGDPDFPLAVRCDRGQSLYGFVGVYHQWIREQVGLDLGGETYERRVLDKSNLDSLCETSYPEDAHWRTLKTLGLKVVGDRRTDESERDVLTNCARLAELLRSRQDLRFERKDDLSTLELLRLLPSLRSLNFNGLGRDQLDFDSLREFSHIAPQELEQVVIMNAGLESISDIFGLAESFRIRRLEISRSKLKSLAGIEKFLDIEEIYLAQNELLDLKGLEQLKSLRSLSARSNKLDEESLQSVLPALTHLQILDLSHNQITRFDFAYAPNLSNLVLAQNPLEQLQGLGKQVALEHLNLTGTRLLAESLQQELKALINLRVLEINGLGIYDLDFLRSLTSLEKLSLAQNQLSDISLFQQFHWPKLTWLSLANNQIRSLNDLGTQTQIRTLWVGGNPVMAGACPQNAGPEVLRRWCRQQRL